MIRPPKKKIEKQDILIEPLNVEFRNIEEAELNAQEMGQEDFKRLVSNIKRDGVLTSAPLVMRQKEKEKFRCISGHHRIKAAILAGLTGATCLVIDEVDETTRIRLQLSHNDINGESDIDKLKILQAKLSDVDINLVLKEDLDEMIDTLKDIEYTPVQFRYINICLLEESRDKLTELIKNLNSKEDINWLIEKEQYSQVTDLLTLAFEKGFRTPGQAFGLFMDIVEQNKDLIKR